MAVFSSSLHQADGCGAYVWFMSQVVEEPRRRDFLALLAGAGAALGGIALIWPMVESMDPASDVLAAGAPIDIDVSKIAAGQQIVVLWRGSPILVVNRTDDALKTLQNPSVVSQLSDPNSHVHQQPPYAENWHRSAVAQFAVMVGICTHLGCLPEYRPAPDPSSPAPNWPGGYFCPCHGSKYDLAGRVYSGVPAPYNLPVPPYRFVNDKTLRIGENPPGEAFALTSMVQM
jgi:ubiquinol-cytochrome c reductase iron-sulfur subunit